MKLAIIILLFCVVGYSIAFSKYELWSYHVCKTSQLCSNSLQLDCFTYFDFQGALNKTSIRELDPNNGPLNRCVDMYLETRKICTGCGCYRENEVVSSEFNCAPVNSAWASVLANTLADKLPTETAAFKECDRQKKIRDEEAPYSWKIFKTVFPDCPASCIFDITVWFVLFFVAGVFFGIWFHLFFINL